MYECKGISQRTNEKGAEKLATFLFAETPVKRVVKAQGLGVWGLEVAASGFGGLGLGGLEVDGLGV